MKNADPEPRRDRLWTIPNVICGARIVGSFVMVGLAFQEQPTEFTWLFILLSLTDWIDGKIAIWLNQRSDFGARLDSFADFMLYGALMIGFVWLERDVLAVEWPWFAMALASYALTSGAGYWKFGKIPSYHTRGAKSSQWLVLGAAVAALLQWANWPLRVAAVAVTLTNLEATLITLILDSWRADVPSLYHAYRLQRGAGPAESESGA